MPLPDKPLAELPRMVRWFNPRLLGKLFLHVVLSKWFGQYADRRLIHAALDTVPKEELQRRALLGDKVKTDDEGAMWIDYVADLGDGFDSTYAIAYLLAQELLDVDGHITRRGQVLIMGGDEVYPTASRKNYEDRLIYPYERAFPDSTAADAAHPLLFAIPGNHDWYDGLNVFLAYFCRPRAKRIGSWRTHQRRSYFAIQIAPKWWIWAIDIQLASDLDQPQADYFETIAEFMERGSFIILCTAVPGWYGADPKSGAFSVMGYAAWRAERVNKELKIVAVLSGDTHHYSRYSSDDFGVQFITSGGGGAFLHPTHNLKDSIEVEWLKTRPKLLLKTEPGDTHKPAAKPACYPDKRTSRKLLLGNLKFPVLNWDFSLSLGVVYVLSASAGAFWGPFTYWISGLALALLLLAYTAQQEGKTLKVLWSVPHSAVHIGAIALLTTVSTYLNRSLGLSPHDGLFYLPLAFETIVVGGLIAGFIFGLYLLLSCGLLGMSDNDAFSALRLTSYKHFLRIRLKGTEQQSTR